VRPADPRPAPAVQSGQGETYPVLRYIGAKSGAIWMRKVEWNAHPPNTGPSMTASPQLAHRQVWSGHSWTPTTRDCWTDSRTVSIDLETTKH
jgi:hypothetical protein